MDLIQLFKSVTKGLSSFLLFTLFAVVWICSLAGIPHGSKMNATVPSIIPYIQKERQSELVYQNSTQNPSLSHQHKLGHILPKDSDCGVLFYLDWLDSKTGVTPAS